MAHTVAAYAVVYGGVYIGKPSLIPELVPPCAYDTMICSFITD